MNTPKCKTYENILEARIVDKNDEIARLKRENANLYCDIFDLKRTVMRRNALITTLIGVISLMGVTVYILSGNVKDAERRATALSLNTTVERVIEMEKNAGFFEAACGNDIDGATPDINDHPEEYPLITGVHK